MTEPLKTAAIIAPALATSPTLMIVRARLKTAGRVLRAIAFFEPAVSTARNLQAGASA